MIYRVSLDDEVDGHQGYAFYTTKAAANKHLAAWKRDGHNKAGLENTRLCAEIAEAKMPVTEGGVLSLLRQWAAHPNNG